MRERWETRAETHMGEMGRGHGHIWEKWGVGMDIWKMRCMCVYTYRTLIPEDRLMDEIAT